ncbi:MAG TPA: GNAT family N-acetyltransferase [Caulobacteraceae bacterium]
MIETPRLLLRGWRDEDYAPFAALNADPEVMRRFPATHTREESDTLADGNREHIEEHGWGLWAIERRDDGRFLGFVGLARPRQPNPYADEVEVGWRLAQEGWGHGYASEAARASLAYGFERLKLPRIISFTATENERSQAVMRRIGMTRAPDLDFDHPRLPKGHRLERHVVYVINRPA